MDSSTAARIFIYSIGEMLPFALSLKLLLWSQDGRNSPGARLAGIVTIGIIALYGFRAVGYLAHLGGDFTSANPNPLQSLLMLALMFLSMAWNFGLLLMAIDRLRERGRRSRAARRSHRRRQPAPPVAAAGRGMRALRAEQRAFCAAGDRPRRLQGHQRHPWSCHRRCLPAALHTDGANAPAARRPARAQRRRRVLRGAAGIQFAGRRDDRAPHPGGVPGGCRAMRRRRCSDSRYRSAWRSGPATWAHIPTG